MVKERGSKAEEFLGIFESRKKKGVASNDFVKADQDEIVGAQITVFIFQDFNESSDDDEYVDMDKAQKPEVSGTSPILFFGRHWNISGSSCHLIGYYRNSIHIIQYNLRER